MDQVKKDSRFAHISKDCRFHKMPQKMRKVKIDKRFKSMFSDKRFKVKYQVDKRGRPVQTSSNENLKKYYDLNSSSEEESDSNEDEEGNNKYEADKLGDSSSDGEHSAVHEENSDEDEEPENENSSKLSGELLSKKMKKVKETSNVLKKGDKKEKEDSNRMNSSKPARNEIKQTTILQSGPAVSDSDSAGSKDGNAQKTLDTKKLKKKNTEKNTKPVSDDSDSDDHFQSTSEAIQQGIDYARGEGNISSSTDDDSEDSGVEDNEELDHQWGEMEADAVEAKEVSRRLALCNMDWDRIKAQDILVLMNSFKPQGGVVKSVHVYPSEYGIKRMEEDSRLGPAELRSNKEHPDDSSDEDEDSELQRERLRKYQLNRLKYYYAVVTCDTAETADAIYEECDGLEYETSSARIDLRFIPDDMEFEREPTSVADKLLDGVDYKPSSFVTTALNQTKVSLTWEETDPDRLKQTMKKFTKDEVDAMDLKAYLASDSDDEDETEKTGDVNKFRSLLGDSAGSVDEKVQDANMEMEITWEPGLKSATEEAVKKKAKGGQTPWEKYLEKRAEKKREKLDEKMKAKKMKGREASESESEDDDDIPEGVDMNDPFFKDAYSDEETYAKKPAKSDKKKKKKGGKEKAKVGVEEPSADLDLLVMDDDDRKQHFSLEQIMKNEQNQKRKKKKKVKTDDISMAEDTFELDVKDDRFSAMYTTSAYNIDPSAPDYKKTKGMQALVNEKLKRRTEESDLPPVRKAAKLEQPNFESIQSLVKSVKAKAKMNQNNKKKKK